MTSAAVLFYGRRSRTSRTFDDLGFGSLAPSPFSPSSSTSSDSSNSNNQCHRRHHHHDHRRGDLHRRHRHINFDRPDKFRHSSNVLQPSPRPPLPESEAHQGCNDESSSCDINSQENVHRLRGRYYRNDNRLPGSVLLAKERLVQRLRGVSVSRNRENSVSSPSAASNHVWAVDDFTESPSQANQQSTPREQGSKPLGLTHEALSQLHHEIFKEQQPSSKASNECSICLESFVEGNKLVNLPCCHRFHSSCLYPWLQTCGECPYCRSCIMLN
ncbi:probable E3 ubiquitin-protein ligase RHY1A [Amaranthus tricolor]|uniref:probable E3 ubiquitin-protein ligase RHY1A n=1 Tax=Amaranthus tricolor TaxID=29722 RepID=UPI0025868B60|nr:probable E3 ubiquitin-protein ligase RHY1A [Amaranthus tricolor]